MVAVLYLTKEHFTGRLRFMRGGGGGLLPLKDLKFKKNQTILKVFGQGEDRRIKVITFNALRTSGIDDDLPKGGRGTVHDHKLDESIRRAKSKIFEYAFCNHWDWFFTGTLDPSKYDRSNLFKFKHDLTQWLRDVGRRVYHEKLAFLLVPELHADGKSWHVHGFLSGVPLSALHQFQIGDRMGKHIASRVKDGQEVYDWPAYRFKFGFCDLEPVRNPEAASRYVTKYITKDLAFCVSELNAQLYMCSRGLAVAQEINRGVMSANITPDYQNDYCSVSWLEYSDELLKTLNDSFIPIDYYKTRR